MAKLTIRKIESLEPGEAAKEYADGHIPGLYFELRPSGKASWVLRYRHGGKTRKLLIGPYPGIGLAKARDLASKRRGEIADERDPAAEKRDAKVVARIPTDQLVDRVVEQFVERYCKTMLRTWGETKRFLNKEIVGRWKGRRLADIGATDVITMLDDIVDRGSPIAAKRARARSNGRGYHVGRSRPTLFDFNFTRSPIISAISCARWRRRSRSRIGR